MVFVTNDIGQKCPILECDIIVRGKQHAITCDVCNRWQHRKCDKVRPIY